MMCDIIYAGDKAKFGQVGPPHALRRPSLPALTVSDARGTAAA